MDLFYQLAIGLVIGFISYWPVASLVRAWKDRKKRPSSSPSPGPSSSPSPPKSQRVPSPEELSRLLKSYQPASPNVPSPLPPNYPPSSSRAFGTRPATSYGTSSGIVPPFTSVPNPQSPWELLDAAVPKEPKVGYAWGYRIWNMTVGEERRRWDVMGKLIVETDVSLRAHVNNMEWQPGLNMAECTASFIDPTASMYPHHAPMEGCHCGFWCLPRLSDAMKRAGLNTNTDSIPNQYVIGSIVGMGKCIKHSDGWRFEKALVVAFVKPTFVGDVEYKPGYSIAYFEATKQQEAEHSKHFQNLQKLAEKFDVPIVPAEEIESFTESVVKQMWGLQEKSE